MSLRDTKPIRDMWSTDVVESDVDLRARLIYIGVSGRELATLDLDRLANQYRLRRRRS